MRQSTMAMNFGKQAQTSADFDGNEGFVTNDKEEDKKSMQKLEEEFMKMVDEATWSQLASLDEEKQKQLQQTVHDLSTSSLAKLPPPPALHELMTGDRYQQLRTYLATAFFRAYILPYLNLDNFEYLDLINLYESDWSLQDGKGLKTTNNNSALLRPFPPPQAWGPTPLPPHMQGNFPRNTSPPLPSPPPPPPLRSFMQQPRVPFPQDGEGLKLKTTNNNSALLRPLAPPQEWGPTPLTLPSHMQGDFPRNTALPPPPQRSFMQLPRVPFLSQAVPPQTPRFVLPAEIDEIQPFPPLVPEGPLPFPMQPNPTMLPFQAPVGAPGFMGGADGFGGQQAPYFPAPMQMPGFMPGGADTDMNLPLHPATQEFIAKVLVAVTIKLPMIQASSEIEEIVSTRVMQSPLPLPEELARLMKEGPSELEIYLIKIFIKAYILPQPELRFKSYYLKLERAALSGKWEDAKSFLDKQKDGGKAAVKARVIVPYKMTALHIAAFKGHASFIKKMVEFLSKINMIDEVLAMEDDRGFTVLHYVALNGQRDVAELLIQKRKELLNSSVTGQLKPSALSIAVLGTCFGNKSDSTRVLRYLASKATEPSLLCEDLIQALVLNGHLDILLYLLGGFPDYLKDTSNAASILMILAQTPSNFYSGSDLGFWQRCIYPYIPVPSTNTGAKDKVHWFRKLLGNIFSRIKPSSINHIQVSKQKHLCAMAILELVLKSSGVEECFSEQPYICVAAIKSGIIEILRTTFQLCPGLVWIRLRCFLQRNSFLKAAIKYRKENIFKFLMEDKTCFITESLYTSTSLLHRAAKLPPYLGLSCVSGAAFQMQREMQWFKAMEQFVPPTFRYRRENGLTAEELFDMEHKELAAAGETWMKDTSNYCMIVSTLITTVVFASAFTVPGGNTPDGSPIFLWSKAFLVFAVSNALALFSSLMSLLMFLSILTSRFTAEDFLKSLPKRMILGLASLFFAIAAMIIAFGAALGIVLGRRLEWVSIPIILMAAFPVSIFGVLQLPLFIQMIKSTYWSTLSTSKSWD